MQADLKSRQEAPPVPPERAARKRDEGGEQAFEAQELFSHLVVVGGGAGRVPPFLADGEGHHDRVAVGVDLPICIGPI